jgi:hypothetical protein
MRKNSIKIEFSKKFFYYLNCNNEYSNLKSIKKTLPISILDKNNRKDNKEYLYLIGFGNVNGCEILSIKIHVYNKKIPLTIKVNNFQYKLTLFYNSYTKLFHYLYIYQKCIDLGILDYDSYLHHLVMNKAYDNIGNLFDEIISLI